MTSTPDQRRGIPRAGKEESLSLLLSQQASTHAKLLILRTEECAWARKSDRGTGRETASPVRTSLDTGFVICEGQGEREREEVGA